MSVPRGSSDYSTEGVLNTLADADGYCGLWDEGLHLSSRLRDFAPV